MRGVHRQGVFRETTRKLSARVSGLYRLTPFWEVSLEHSHQHSLNCLGRLSVRGANIDHPGTDRAMPERLLPEREVYVAGD